MKRQDFAEKLESFCHELEAYTSDKDRAWKIKGFIDVEKTIFTISSDTKILSKILEIHIFPKVLEFAKNIGFEVVLADHQNYYPDVSFVSLSDPTIKYAVDFKTTYRNPNKPYLCNGFTLGFHGKYFVERNSTKNIQYPYSSYTAHFCLGIIYERALDVDIDETLSVPLKDMEKIVSVISNLDFFAVEKWKIASDKSGSGNTANIGSIQRIDDIISGNGVFSKLGEAYFDEYWMNKGKMTIPKKNGELGKLSNLRELVEFKKDDVSLIVPKNNKKPVK